MKKTKHSESHIAAVLQEYAAGKEMSLICRESGIDRATLQEWHQKYRGMSAGEIRRKCVSERNEMLLMMMMMVWMPEG